MWWVTTYRTKTNAVGVATCAGGDGGSATENGRLCAGEGGTVSYPMRLPDPPPLEGSGGEEMEETEDVNPGEQVRRKRVQDAMAKREKKILSEIADRIMELVRMTRDGT